MSNRFLLARLLAELFASLQTKRQINDLIRSLSVRLGGLSQHRDLYWEIYHGTLERINGQSPVDRDLAMQAIMWITNAARPMSPNELCCALSIEPGDTIFDEENWRSAEMIVSVCAGLVVVDKESDIIQIVHYTAQEFFDDYQHDKIGEVQRALATTCLTYLCFEQPDDQSHASGDPTLAPDGDDVGSNANLSDEAAESAPFEMTPGWRVHHQGEVLYGSAGSYHESSYTSKHSSRVHSVDIQQSILKSQKACLTDYAANFWSFHAHDYQPDLLQPALRLLKDQRLAARAFQSATSLYQPWPVLHFSPKATSMFGTGRSAMTQVTGLHLIAALGLAKICEALLETIDKAPGIHADARDEGRRTALMWAAHHGHENIVRMLLSRSDVHSTKKCRRGETALIYAARRGWTAIAEIILTGGYVKNTQWLCTLENQFGETALVRAALEGHEDMVRLLGKWDTLSIHREVIFGEWPIHLVAQMRPASTMRLLVEVCGVDTERKNPKGYTPFIVAVDWGNEDVVKYFLRERREQLMRDNGKQIQEAAFLAASNWKRLKILQYLVEEVGFVLNALNEHGETLLQVAIKEGNTQAVIYLSPHLRFLNTELSYQDSWRL